MWAVLVRSDHDFRPEQELEVVITNNPNSVDTEEHKEVEDSYKIQKDVDCPSEVFMQMQKEFAEL